MNTVRTECRWQVVVLVLGIAAFCTGVLWKFRPGDNSPAPPIEATSPAADGFDGARTEQIEYASEVAAPAAFAEKLGIEIEAVQLGVGGTRLNLRYRVIDPIRATQLTNWSNPAYLVDSYGRRLSLPNSPKAAPIRRESGQQLRADRMYSHFFPNPGMAVKPGDQVTLVIGNLRAENLLVQ
ncbi:MAG: hypothetical protein AB9869_34380 [Verrucomicrobiia bacterium]